MTEYYNINYNNDDIDKLDKLAREINNKKTLLCKKVTNDFNENQDNWKNGIDNVINSQKFSYLPMNKNYNKGIYNDTITNDTDKTSGTNYSISDMSDISYESDFSRRDNNFFDTNLSDINSVDSFFDSESIDTYLTNSKNKKNVKFNKIVESIDYDECSKNEDNIFEHVKKCINCKNKLLKFLNNSSSSNNDCKYSKIFDGNINNNIKKDYNIKEITIFLMIGIFIIIILDILLRNR
jgi:hypothetical protein